MSIFHSLVDDPGNQTGGADCQFSLLPASGVSRTRLLYSIAGSSYAFCLQMPILSWFVLCGHDEQHDQK